MRQLFAHPTKRPFQERITDQVTSALKNRQPLLLHAPTGLGKTAGALCPAISFALENGLRVLFCTARQTQHAIVLETLRKLNERHNTRVLASSLVSKKALCAQSDAAEMPQLDFLEWCHALRERRECNYYIGAREEKSRSNATLAVIQRQSPLSAEQLKVVSAKEGCCPYEMALITAEHASVVTADYSYAFHHRISESFFKKTGWTPANTILIIDEAHNLPQRLRDMLTARLTTRMIEYGLREAKKFKQDETITYLVELQDVLVRLAKHAMKTGANVHEVLITKDDFMKELEKTAPLSNILIELENSAEKVREERRRSSLSGIATFLEDWHVAEQGYARILRVTDRGMELRLRCLDPSIASAEVLQKCHSVVAMSGTLTPTTLFKDLLGFPKHTATLELPSPFPSRNRLALVIPKTTTQFRQRSPQQFKAIANVCIEICNTVPGCVAFYFPSYEVRNAVLDRFASSKELLLEEPGMSKEEREALLNKLRSLRLKGAVLMAVASGSFSEGVDMPGVLSAVGVIGLPLERPDLETKERIRYYDSKFPGKGWDYGYVMPALTKCVQAAGRCIRSETDRGALLFIDERFAWPRYRYAFPKEWETKVSFDYVAQLKRFFNSLSHPE